MDPNQQPTTPPQSMPQQAVSSVPPQMPDRMQSTYDSSDESHGMRNFLLILLGVLVLLGLTGGAYYLGTKNTASNTVSSKDISPTIVASPTPNPTANWKLYANSQYNFSFKYPENIFQTSFQNANPFSIYLSNQDARGLQNNNLVELSISVLPASSKTVNELMQEQIQTTGDGKGTGVLRTIGGESGYTITFSEPLGQTGKYSMQSTVVKGQYKYTINMFVGTKAELTSNKDLYNQILSTFSFATTSTADWKTYSQHGFTLQYPKGWAYKEEGANPLQLLFYDPATATRGGNGGYALVYTSILRMTALPAQTGETVKQYIDTVESQQVLKDQFQRKLIILNGQETEVYHIGGEGFVGWYIPFARAAGFDIFGPLGTDPSQDSIQLDIVKTFKITQ